MIVGQPSRREAPGDVDLVEAVVKEVRRSRRYRWVSSALVRRVARDELPKAKNLADAVKRAKRRLHQVCGAYLDDLRVDAALDALRHAKGDGGEEGLKRECQRIMARHASARERLPTMERFYREIFEETGMPRVVADLACGLGPLALPWMGLSPDARYLAYDVDARLVELVDGFLTLLGVPHVAEVRDVLSDPPTSSADVALLLKSAPCLDQEQPGSLAHVLPRLNAPHVVVSFPRRSLGGAAKGMQSHYRASLEQALAATGEPARWRVTERQFPLESVYVLGDTATRAGTTA